MMDVEAGDETTTPKLLEERILNLEKQVYGLSKTMTIEDVLPENSITDSLVHVNTLISSALSGREKANAIMKRLPELNSYLDITCDELDLPVDVKIHLLLTMESEIRENHKLLTEIQELIPALETDHVQDIPELSNKLHKLSLTHLELHEGLESLSVNIQQLFCKYNAIITKISKSLITLDAAIRAAEMTNIPKKRVD